MDQAVVGAGGVGAQDEDAAEREGPGRPPRPPARAGVKWRSSSASPVAPGVGGQVDRREEGADGDRQRPDHRPRGVGPAGPDVAGGVALGHAPRGDPAEGGAEEEGREHRGDGERRPVGAAHPEAGRDLAEGEARPAQDDAERRQREGDEQRGEDRAVGRREGGPEDHQDEDQPDVVRLPDRPDGAVDERARRLRRAGRPRRSGPRSRRRSRRRRAGRRGSRRSSRMTAQASTALTRRPSGSRGAGSRQRLARPVGDRRVVEIALAPAPRHPADHEHRARRPGPRRARGSARARSTRPPRPASVTASSVRRIS